ncbi:AzlC family ABC transporter permease [Magnetovibrio sp.]|uniref:AzlC family ABC transporter permease n=1 Tax=Magnetovibrio sp. TaxID=2024836 RepID=UPI002F91CA5C
MTDTHAPDRPSAFCSPRAAFWGGAREAAGVPMMVMGASFVGFGSMIHDLDWSVWHALFSTLSTWALPGQIAMAEMAYSGAPLMALVLAVGFINARLLPLAVSLLPHVRRPEVSAWTYYAVAMLIAATSWVGTMRRLPDLSQDQRLHYLTGYGLALYLNMPLATVIGFYLAGQVPQPITLALVFLNPLYFLLLFLFDLRNVAKVLSLTIGALLGPLLYQVAPDWSLIATGLVGGTAAWWVGRSPWGRRVQSAWLQRASKP